MLEKAKWKLVIMDNSLASDKYYTIIKEAIDRVDSSIIDNGRPNHNVLDKLCDAIVEKCVKEYDLFNGEVKHLHPVDDYEILNRTFENCNNIVDIQRIRKVKEFLGSNGKVDIIMNFVFDYVHLEVGISYYIKETVLAEDYSGFDISYYEKPLFGWYD